MYKWMAAFNVGLIILYCSGRLLPFHYYILIIVAAFLFLRARVALILACVCFGAMYLNGAAQAHRSAQLPASWEGVEVQVSGYICSLPKTYTFYSSVEFCANKLLRLSDLESLDLENVGGSRRLILSIPKKIALDPDQLDQTFLTKLKRPHSTFNPGIPSYEKVLFYKQIAATGSVKEQVLRGNVEELGVEESGVVEKGVVESWRRYAEQGLLQARWTLRTNLLHLVDSFEHKGLIIALLLGDRSLISESDNHDLKMTGTQHLLAISGLHVGLVMFFSFAGLRRCLGDTKFTIVLSAVVGLIYIFLVGFGASAQRAWVMSVLVLPVVLGLRQGSPWRAFILAMFVVLVIDPLAPMSLGFWFSFSAAAVLLAINNLKLLEFNGNSLIFVQLLIVLALVPLNAQFALPQSGLNCLANLIAIPWISLVVLPGVLLTSVLAVFDSGMAVAIYRVLNEVLHVLMGFLDSIANIALKFAWWDVAAQFEWEMFLFLVALAGFGALFRFTYLSLFLGVSLSAFVFAHDGRANEETAFWVLDSGQGLAISIYQPDDLWLYDLGPSYQQGSFAERALVPFVASQFRRKSLDGLILSHGDDDHAGGTHHFLSYFRSGRVWTGEAERLSSVVEGDDCYQGMKHQSERLYIEVLYPPVGYEPDSSNNHSCVVKVILNNVVFLLMGDLEGAGERYFLKHYRGDLRADVLIAGHHGSKNATSYALLKRVRPQVVIFSAAYRSRFGHPSWRVIERLDGLGIKHYSTATSGGIRINPEGGKFEVTESRLEAKDKVFWLGTF